MVRRGGIEGGEFFVDLDKGGGYLKKFRFRKFILKKGGVILYGVVIKQQIVCHF